MEFIGATIEKVAVHYVGNQTNEQALRLSKELLDLSDVKLKELLIRYFLSPFASAEFHAFTFSNGDCSLNPLYQFSSHIFERPASLHKNSVHMARHLFEVGIHPQIKAGDFFVASFSGIKTADGIYDAIGIFKSENRQSFLKLDDQNETFTLMPEAGIQIDKLDKGCLILNSEKEHGFKVCVIDKSNKSIEAQYWKDLFLQVKPFQDEYHQTKEFLTITKDFVTKQLGEEFEISKADKIDLLNRSVNYFKSHDTFDKKDFESEVFQDKNLIESFQSFDESYRETHAIEVPERFEISAQAVKKQARVFKSVLKLDKNFHIYIHGNRELIEQGVEKDGRKYYKIYFENEV